MSGKSHILAAVQVYSSLEELGYEKLPVEPGSVLIHWKQTGNGKRFKHLHPDAPRILTIHRPDLPQAGHPVVHGYDTDASVDFLLSLFSGAHSTTGKVQDLIARLTSAASCVPERRPPPPPHGPHSEPLEE